MKKRALISVFDKGGILEFSKYLVNKNIEIISTGGTYKYLKENNIPVIEISDITKFPEMLDGRVKTLHPNIHGGILAIRNNQNHMDIIKEHNIHPIDFVVVNLYPFFDKVQDNSLSFEQKVEFIDIGGPTMLRAAAKNFQDVVVICDKNDYKEVQQHLESGEVSLETKKKLAGKVFNLMSAYDGAISQFMLEEENYQQYWSTSLKMKQPLRYGENPHQSACFYESTMKKGAMNTFEILNGKELSYNNFKDVDIAWKAVSDFGEPACCALKHNTPCGFAIGKDAYDCYKKAHGVDQTSIFGGIVSFNRKVTKNVAEEMHKIFLEVIAAPEYDEDALQVLKTKKNLRVLKFHTKPICKHQVISVDGGLLVQSVDDILEQELKVVTNKQPSSQEKQDLLFAMKVVKWVKSNAIVVAKDGVALGIGGGQVNRIWPTEDALKRGKGGTVLASDAFFPFRDVVDACAKAGIQAIIQPGGSLKDQESIDACNEHNISMIFTNVRHFKH
ncbi:MAG: bifunctional phosphoribosylaminoimidazolecarboxamide formyltransferase/IMP cyclohydrolase [Mycoplasmataceae bacterium]|nr:bifunctional phosphoribosylaminoimidazolecarboxamide formyltransferase/IMP cyclohydrolase [Mycoplasmataceae bacterium]